MQSAKCWMKLWALLGFAAGVAVSSVHGETATVNGTTWSYTVEDGKATVTGVTPATGTLTIPSKLGGYAVTGIGSSAFFRGCGGVTAVTIPASVTDIEVATIQFFGACSCPFSACNGLTDIRVEAGNPVYASRNGVLFTKDGKTLLFCPKGKTGEHVVPDGVEQIGTREQSYGEDSYVRGWPGFAGCSKLKSVAIPASVTGIAEKVFDGCKGLVEIRIAASNSVYTSKDGVLFSKDGKTLLACPPGKTGAYSVPDGVAGIGNYSFSSTHYGLVPMGWCGFDQCAKLTAVTLPSSVAYITGPAFNGCSLKSLTMFSSNVVFGSYDDYDNVAESVNFDGVETLYVPALWKGTDMLSDAYVPSSCKVEYVVPVFGSDNRTFPPEAASSKELTVATKGTWTAKSDAAWLTLKRASGTGNGVVVYNVAANPGTGSRTGGIILSGNGFSRVFTVKQLGRKILELESSERTFTAATASGKLLGVTAHVAWTAKSSVPWLTVKRGSGTGNGTLVYDVATNTGSASRTGKIMVSGGGVTRTFTVTQLGKGVAAKLELAATARTFTKTAESSKELEVKANVAWAAKSGASWLTVKKGSGKGNGLVTYNVAANTGMGTRKGSITVQGGGLTRTFTVTQLGEGVLELASTARTFTATAASSKELEVAANVTWSAKSSVAWLSVKKGSGTGDGVVVYGVEPDRKSEHGDGDAKRDDHGERERPDTDFHGDPAR